MSEVISIQDAIAQIAKLENEIRKGALLVLPVEGSYIYVADAFNISAVKRIHELRGDEPGIAAAVAIASPQTLEGIATNISDEMRALAKKFWPGLLTLLVQPNSALAWDLGDSGDLGEFAVRVPDSQLLISLAKNIGPLAFAAAATAGSGAARNLDSVSAISGEINIYVDGGELANFGQSTIVRAKVIGQSALEVLRVGAISLEQLQEEVPAISLAKPL